MEKQAKKAGPDTGSAKNAQRIPWMKLLFLAVALVLGIVWVGKMIMDSQYAFAVLFAVIIGAGVLTFGLNKLYPHRYIFPGVAGMVVFIIFPLVYTIYISFTNYSAKNLFTLERAEQFHLSKTYRVEGGSYSYDILKRAGDQHVIVLKSAEVKNEDGTVTPSKIYASDPVTLYNKEQMTKPVNKSTASKATIKVREEASVNGELCGIKCKIMYRDYLKLVKVQLDDKELSMTDLNSFGAVKKKFKKIKNKLLANNTQVSAEDYNGSLLLDQQENRLFAPDMSVGYYRYLNETDGSFVGDNYTPGFIIGVGFDQFKKIATDPNISEPFIKIFIWTVCFAAGTVFITLAIGMVLACLAQWEFLKGRGFYRVMLILPYAVPSFISILVFKGLFNENFGEINRILDFFFGIKPDWFGEAGLARSMILIVNAWLGYPYMMILCMGLLKSISDDLYEASAMDGAGPFQNFFKITLPLLMKPLTPLLIASFAFNFNNFVLIMLLTNGGPDFIPEEGSTTASMAGHTDLLVSYTYRLAFEGGAGGNDYGLASAIATTIFILVGALSVVNLKLSKMAAKE